MASIVILVFALIMRLLMAVIKKPLWVGEIVRYAGAVLPLVLIILGGLENDGISIIFAGICFFWFPMISKK